MAGPKSRILTLQHEYLGQYFKSTYLSYLLPKSMSRYTILERTTIDPKTKEESVLAVMDDDIVPDLDDDDHLQVDQSNHVKVLLKSHIEHKSFAWQSIPIEDGEAYAWFRQHIYRDKSFIGIWAPAWLGALLFLLGGIGLGFYIDMIAQRRYLKGEPIRGTRKLSLRAYAQEHQHHLGYKFKVYDPK